MSTPNITENISRIQDKLVAIVTRDLIAGKVTSVRDAPRIVSIGRVIAELDHVADAVFELEEIVEDQIAGRPEEGVGARAEEGPKTVEEFWEGLAGIERARDADEERARQAEEIVADLADVNPVVRDMGYHCVLCREEPVRWRDMTLSEHSPSCPWRRALEWVEEQESAADEERGDRLQASLRRAVDEAWVRAGVDLVDPEDDAGRAAEQEAADMMEAAERARLENLVRARLLNDSGKRYTLAEVCEILGVPLEELGEEE